jgi:mono/diheme cytochrome c family protein
MTPPLRLLGTALLLLATTALAAPATAPSAPTPLPGRVVDVAGRVQSLRAEDDVAAVAIVFLGTECPIANRAIPTLNDLSAELAGNGIRVVGVISDPAVTPAAAAKHAADYQIQFPLLLDSGGEVARALKPTHTPYALVLDRAGAVRYRGRIDDSFAGVSKPRQVVEHHDLRDAALAVANGAKVTTPETPAVGCVFEAWNVAADAAAVTWSRDVAPILYANCLSCHRDGQAAPFPLLTYDDAAKRAQQIAAVVDARLMPPWKPEPGFGHFLDERRLTDAQVATIRRWADAGAPRGDPSAAPTPPTFPGEWALGEPDLVVEMPEPFDVPAGGRDVYRAFVAKVDVPDDKYVTAFEFKPGSPTVVHHCMLFLDDAGRARELDAKDPGPGYRSFGGPGFVPSGGLGGWAPGAQPRFLPEGIGRPVHKGADLIFQMHYHPDGRPRQDRSKVGLYFAKKPVTQIAVNFPVRSRQIDIAPRDAHYVVEAGVTTPVPVTLGGITPHMHLLGKEMTVEAKTPDGSVIPLIKIADWDFRWQDQYRFADPIRLPAGTVVSMRCVYDNSADNPNNPNTPPQRVRHGEQTTDEMALCFLQIYAPVGFDRARLRRPSDDGAPRTAPAGTRRD